MQDQKEKTAQLYSFIVKPNAHLTVLGADTSPVAYLLHVAGTNKVRVLYGLSPVVQSAFMPSKPKAFRALMRDLEKETDTVPGMMSLPEDILKLEEVTMPTLEHVIKVLDEDTLAKNWPYFKTGTANGALQPDEKDARNVMKIAPVPLFAVIDGLERDLEAVDVFERLKFLAELETTLLPAYMAHAMHFCASAMTKYTSAAKKVTVSAAVFATLPSQVDKTWALGRILTLCPRMPAPAQGQGSGGMDSQMLMLMQQMISQQVSSGAKATGSAPMAKDPDAEVLDEKSWEKKLNLSKLGLEDLLSFCGLERGEEDCLPKLWTTLGEEGMKKAQKQRVIRKALARDRKFDDVEAPVTVALLKVIANMDWSEGEMTVTISNLMKGLSIFAMRPLTDEEISSYNDYDENLERASSTTVRDVAGGSGKRKHHVPETCTELLEYLKALTNILYALSGNQCPLGHDILACIKRLQRMSLSARRGMDRQMIGAIMWAILEESRRFFNDPDSVKTASFRAMLSALDSSQRFDLIGMPNGLFGPDAKTPKNPKGKKEDDDRKGKGKGKRGAPVGEVEETPPGSPEKQTKLRGDQVRKAKRHPILESELGAMVTHAQNRKGWGLYKFCEAAGVPMWEAFPRSCGHLALFEKCTSVRCKFNHDDIDETEAKFVVDKFKKVVDEPTIITG